MSTEDPQVREAIEAISTIHKDVETARETARGNEQAIKDLTENVRRLTEAQNRASMRVEDASERDLVERYVYQRDDGAESVRMSGEYDASTRTYSPGLLDDYSVRNDWLDEVRGAVSRRSLVRLFAKPRGMNAPYADSPHTDSEIRRLLRNAPGPMKRIFADASGLGAEWIPDVTLPQVDMEVRAARRVEALFPTVQMADKTVVLPRMTVGLRPYLKGAATTDDPAQYTSSTLTTSSNTYSAQSFAVRMQVDDDASEDSILAIEPIVRGELVAALVDGFEDGILNGDTTATHQDTIASWDIRSRWGASGLGTSADHRRAFIGLRARAADVSNTTDGSGAETFAGILSQRAKLDAPLGLNDCVIITSPEYYLANILKFSEVVTLDKYGPQATVLTGEVARLGGMPVIISEFMGADLNASGVYDNSTKDYTGVLVVNRARFFVGQRRGAMLEVDRDITRGMRHWVATVRKTFQTYDSSSKKNVHYSYKHSKA